jgi:flagellar motor switch protein FliN
MSSAAAPAPAPHPLAGAFSKAMAEVFSKTLGAEFAVEVARDPQTTTPADAVWFGCSFSGDIQGEAAIQFALSDAILLARKSVAETANAEFSATDKQAVEELLHQVLDVVASTLEAQFGAVKSKVTSISAPSWRGLSVLLRVSEARWSDSPAQLLISEELIEAMAMKSKVADSPSEAGADMGTNAEQSLLEESIPAPADNMDLLWVVGSEQEIASLSEKDLNLMRRAKLNLTLRFGMRTLPLKEVLALSSGSVIELDREVSGPADLLLGDKVVGRGEVVIVDGNYGVRVTEVAGPRRRTERMGA